MPIYPKQIILSPFQQPCQIPSSSSTSKVASYTNNSALQRDARQRYSGCIESAANLDKIETICEAAGGAERARSVGLEN